MTYNSLDHLPAFRIIVRDEIGKDSFKDNLDAFVELRVARVYLVYLEQSLKSRRESHLLVTYLLDNLSIDERGETEGKL